MAGGYGEFIEGTQEKLADEATRLEGVPQEGADRYLQMGANVAGKVLPQIPLAVATGGAAPLMMAGQAALQDVGQGHPEEAATDALWAGLGAKAGQLAENVAGQLTKGITTRAGREVAGRAITGAAGATVGAAEAGARGYNEDQTLSTVAANALGSALLYGGAKSRAHSASPPETLQTLHHDNPRLHGKPIVATREDGRLVVANPENKTGISVVKGKQVPREGAAAPTETPRSVPPIVEPARAARFKVESASDNDVQLSERIGQPITHEQLARLVGAPDGAEVRAERAYHYGLDKGAPLPAVHISVFRPGGGNQQRVLYRAADGKLVLFNEQLQKPRGAKEGWGAEVLAQQIEEARRLGVDRIEAWATGKQGDVRNGYYTLARWGFDGELPASIRDKAPARLRDAQTLQELFARPGGAEWWKRNGKALAVTFDLRPNSPAARIFRAYQAQQPGTPSRPLVSPRNLCRAAYNWMPMTQTFGTCSHRMTGLKATLLPVRYSRQSHKGGARATRRIPT